MKSKNLYTSLTVRLASVGRNVIKLEMENHSMTRRAKGFAEAVSRSFRIPPLSQGASMCFQQVIGLELIQRKKYLLSRMFYKTC